MSVNGLFVLRVRDGLADTGFGHDTFFHDGSLPFSGGKRKSSQGQVGPGIDSSSHKLVSADG
jgi:hypothetical protein